MTVLWALCLVGNNNVFYVPTLWNKHITRSMKKKVVFLIPRAPLAQWIRRLILALWGLGLRSSRCRLWLWKFFPMTDAFSSLIRMISVYTAIISRNALIPICVNFELLLSLVSQKFHIYVTQRHYRFSVISKSYQTFLIIY